ncbi:hypothetical protein EUGRSUZ_I00784 [Eucalyptus grandis]|uniref:DUF4283 domain-containing protein n=2 Tax=Eucalyptus grandis TaxID=71139 RepID=A0A059AMC4_EUCGR|nr:hypothetical protein EUGRSUZ_I00784 [Eucalyptus grandis]
MENEEEKQLRVAALCRSLGHLWSEKDVTVREEVPTDKITECQHTLFGKLLSHLNVNFQAFCTTMKKAWKVNTVLITQKEPGFFSFMFESDEDKERVLNTGPWFFSSNLLVLKQCVPDIPEHCYDFSRYDFWVHIRGLPPGWILEEVYADVTGKIGKVKEIQLELQDNSFTKPGKVRVELDLSAPLKIGILVQMGAKKMWVEFKYERLPHYCYSCGPGVTTGPNGSKKRAENPSEDENRAADMCTTADKSAKGKQPLYLLDSHEAEHHDTGDSTR